MSQVAHERRESSRQGRDITLIDRRFLVTKGEQINVEATSSYLVTQENATVIQDL
jgi:hypothetical protein